VAPAEATGSVFALPTMRDKSAVHALRAARLRVVGDVPAEVPGRSVRTEDEPRCLITAANAADADPEFVLVRALAFLVRAALHALAVPAVLLPGKATARQDQVAIDIGAEVAIQAPGAVRVRKEVVRVAALVTEPEEARAPALLETRCANTRAVLTEVVAGTGGSAGVVDALLVLAGLPAGAGRAQATAAIGVPTTLPGTIRGAAGWARWPLSRRGRQRRLRRRLALLLFLLLPFPGFGAMRSDDSQEGQRASGEASAGMTA
jgi:hypothetical protein